MMNGLCGQRMAGAIGLVLAISTPAFGQQVRRGDSVGFTLCELCPAEVMLSLQSFVYTLQYEDPGRDSEVLWQRAVWLATELRERLRLVAMELRTDEEPVDESLIAVVADVTAIYATLEDVGLESFGDDAQLANVELQNVLQKQQQTLQMISNISKLLCDTAVAIIRKIGS
jgi:hypothetical protein